MTDQEKRDLSLRMATLAEQAGLPGELVWEKHDRCERQHEPLYYIKDDAVVHEGRYCGQCYQAYGNAVDYRTPETDEEKDVVRRVFADHPDGFVRRSAKDLTNPQEQEWFLRLESIGYTGRSCAAEITYILRDLEGRFLQPGMAALSIRKVEDQGYAE